MKKFCPECGSTKGKFIKGFCEKCFLKKFSPVHLPQLMEFDSCNKCGKMRLKGIWVEMQKPFLTELIKNVIQKKEFEVKEIELDLKPMEKGLIPAVALIEGRSEGTAIRVPQKFSFKPLKGICDACMKLSSDYHEAVIQMRFKEKAKQRELEEKIFSRLGELAEREKKKDSLSKITKVIRDRKGFDVWVGSKRSGRKLSEEIAKEFNSKVIYSFTTIGLKDSGKPKKRFTFCVKL